MPSQGQRRYATGKGGDDLAFLTIRAANAISNLAASRNGSHRQFCPGDKPPGSTSAWGRQNCAFSTDGQCGDFLVRRSVVRIHQGAPFSRH